MRTVREHSISRRLAKSLRPTSVPPAVTGSSYGPVTLGGGSPRRQSSGSRKSRWGRPSLCADAARLARPGNALMLSRRALAIAMGAGILPRRAFAATPRRLALLLASPWEGESFMSNDLALMQGGLRVRGVNATGVISVLAPLDRPSLVRRLEDVRGRIANWPDGDLLIYYNGRGMYRPAINGGSEPGLQLNRNREHPASALLWRELFAELQAPPRVRVIVLPDCCHTNLLAGRLPPNVTDLIIKSEPQNSLTCRTGTAFFGDPPGRARHGVISYYAGRTFATVDTAGEWLSAFNTAAERDVSERKLEKARRVSLMIRGRSIASRPR